MQNKILFLFLIFSLGLISATNFNSCQTFALSDTYDQTDNIQINGSTCLTIAIPVPTSRTVIDCHGYYIEGNLTSSTYGASLVLSNDVTIQNCIFRNFAVNFISTDGDNILIQNSTFDNASASGLQLCTSTICQNLTFINNTVSNSFNNGIENYGSNNSIFNNNTCNNQDHGHGTDRCYQNVRNVYNTEFAYNWVWNNTIGIRSDNTNVSNFSAHHNRFENFSQGLNMQTTSGTFNLFNFSDNNLSSTAYNSTGFDITFPASATKESDCSNITLNNNIVTGGDFWYLNELNSSQIISNSIIGGMIICNADNVQLYNLTLIGGGGGRNAIELLYANNLTIVDYHASNFYTALRGLIVNDSTFRNSDFTGGQISAINFAGGGAHRNLIDNFSLSQISANSGVSFGGDNNIAQNGVIYNSTTSGTPLNFQSATTVINNTFINVSIYDTERGIGITSVGAGNSARNIYMKNVRQAFTANSTASGTKTFEMRNITLVDSTESYFTTFDYFDTIDPSAVYIINQPDPTLLPALGNSSYVDTQSYLNITSLGTVNSTIDELNLTISEVPIEFSRLGWWELSNLTTWSEAVVTNNNAGTLTYTGVKAYVGNNLIHNIFYLDMCPTVNQPGYIVPLQDYSGAPNAIGAGVDFACVVINTSNVIFDCQNPGSGMNAWINNTNISNAAAIHINSGMTNVSIQNCQENAYAFGLYAPLTNNQLSLASNTFFNNTDTGAYINSAADVTLQSNQFNLNNYALTMQAVTNAYAFLNTVTNSVLFGVSLGSSSSNHTFSQNILDSNNVDFSMLSVSNINLDSNTLTNSAFQSLQLINTNSIGLLNNIMSNGGDAVFGQSNSNAYVYNNTIGNFNNGIYLDSGSANYLEANIVYNTAQYALLINEANQTTGQNNHFFNNTYSIYVLNATTTRNLELNTNIFDQLGTFENFTNLSISDDAAPTESYWLNWSALNDPTSTGNVSYGNTSIRLTNVSNMSISTMIWQYDSAGFNASVISTFDVWRYVASWSKLSATSGVRMLTLSSVDTTADYSILYDANGAPQSSGGNVLIPLAHVGAYGLTAYLIYRQMQRSRGRGARIWLFG